MSAHHETRTFRGRPACAGSVEQGIPRYRQAPVDWEEQGYGAPDDQLRWRMSDACSVCGREGISPVYKGANEGKVGTHIHAEDLA